MSFIIERKGTKFSAPEYVRSPDEFDLSRYTPYRNRAHRFTHHAAARDAHLSVDEQVTTL